MRELYACQLDLQETSEEVGVTDLLLEWMARRSGVPVGRIRDTPDQVLESLKGHQLELFFMGGASAAPGGWTCSWRQPDSASGDLVWRTLIACGPVPGSRLIRVSLRVRLEWAGESFRLAPLQHEFGPPGIVQVLLRRHLMEDAGVRVEPRYRERRAADVADLVGFLLNPDRRLPVFVVTRGPGAHLVDAAVLAQRLAGLAHVEVLSTHLAAMALTDVLGRDCSVWGGAVRLYWPNFSRADPPFRHRLWIGARLESARDFIGDVLGLLGSLGAAIVPEHPIVRLVRLEKRGRVHSEELPGWAEEYIEEVDRDLELARKEVDQLHAAWIESERSREGLIAELESVKREFQVFQEISSDEPVAVDLDLIDVAAAYQLARDEAHSSIVFLPEVDRSIEDFLGYRQPRRLYEALTAVSEAGEAWNDEELRAGFGAFFAERGFDYSKNNPAAMARSTKRYYQRNYEGGVVIMAPHLKVDQATSPDQCLRIYWYLDEERRRLIIGHVGRHLPSS